MKLLKLKFFNFKFFTLFLMIFLLSSKTVFAGFQGKVTAKALETVQAALIKAGTIKGSADVDALEKTFRASTASHRLRLSELFLKIQKDPAFIKNFPEYAPLVENPSKTVEMLLKHDAGKADPEGNLAVRALSLLQGYDYRNRNKDLPEDVDLLVRTLLKDSIDDINELEKKYVAHGTAFDSQIGSLAEVLDYYDMSRSRKNEIKGRKLMGPRQWLDFLYKNKDLSADAKKELSLQKRFATYLEMKDPLLVKSAYTQTADVLKKVGSNPVKDVAKYFSSRGQKLVGTPKLPKIRTVVSGAAKGSRRVPVLGGALVAADYLISPEDFSIRDTIESAVMSLTLTSQTSACATILCSEFIQQCADKIGVKNKFSETEVTAHKDFGHCVFDFFQQPLEIQSEKRRDSDLNNLLLAFSPAVRGLTCDTSGTELKVTIETMKKSKDIESQVIQFNQSGQVTLATRLPERQDQIQFEGRSASSLRHCPTGTECKQYKMDFVKNESTYFWKNKTSSVSKTRTIKIPVQAFRWAKSNSGFLEMQSENIKNCCDSNKCRKSFEENGAPSATSMSGQTQSSAATRASSAAVQR